MSDPAFHDLEKQLLQLGSETPSMPVEVEQRLRGRFTSLSTPSPAMLSQSALVLLLVGLALIFYFWYQTRVAFSSANMAPVATPSVKTVDTAPSGHCD